MSQPKVLVTGSGGFIGHHLVTYLKRKGSWVHGRNSDNTCFRQLLNWAPKLSLEEAFSRILNWIDQKVSNKIGIAQEQQVR